MKGEQFGMRLRAQRKAHGYNIEQLAEAIDVTPNYLGALERGIKKPSFDCLLRIVNTLQISADALLMDVVDVPNAAALDHSLTEKLMQLQPEQRGAALAIMDEVVQQLGRL